MISPLDLLSIESWLLLITVLGLTRYYVHRKWQYLKYLNIPHDPPSLRKFGHLAYTFDKKIGFEWDNQQKTKHGTIWGSYSFFSPVITIHDPDMLRQVFIKEFRTFPIRRKGFTKVSGKELNTRLTAVEGAQWKRIRSTITPTFSTSKLKQMTSIIEWCAGNTIDALNRKLKDGAATFDNKEFFSRLSMDIVCSAAFSTRVDSQDDSVKEPEISKQAKKLLSFSFSSRVLLLLTLFPTLENLIEKLNMSIFPKHTMDYFRNFANAIMKQRRDDPDVKGRVDLMQLMLQTEIADDEAEKGLEKGMTKTEIIGNSIMMILAGYETTGGQMAMFAYNMAQHPKIQENVQQEIDEMMQKHGRIDYEGMNSLKLLDMCINESMRLYLPILRNSRVAENEITINGLTIPKGVRVSIPSYGLAHDPDYWDDPYEFKPERMEDMSQIDPMMFQPFGAGPRNCIGMRFALMEIKLSMAKILHHFSFVPAENTPKPPLNLAPGVSLRPAVPYDLRAVPRNKSDEQE